jgi:hypothetical protein
MTETTGEILRKIMGLHDTPREQDLFDAFIARDYVAPPIPGLGSNYYDFDENYYVDPVASRNSGLGKRVTRDNRTVDSFSGPYVDPIRDPTVLQPYRPAQLDPAKYDLSELAGFGMNRYPLMAGNVPLPSGSSRTSAADRQFSGVQGSQDVANAAAYADWLAAEAARQQRIEYATASGDVAGAATAPSMYGANQQMPSPFQGDPNAPSMWASNAQGPTMPERGPEIPMPGPDFSGITQIEDAYQRGYIALEEKEALITEEVMNIFADLHGQYAAAETDFAARGDATDAFLAGEAEMLSGDLASYGYDDASFNAEMQGINELLAMNQQSGGDLLSRMSTIAKQGEASDISDIKKVGLAGRGAMELQEMEAVEQERQRAIASAASAQQNLLMEQEELYLDMVLAEGIPGLDAMQIRAAKEAGVLDILLKDQINKGNIVDQRAYDLWLSGQERLQENMDAFAQAGRTADYFLGDGSDAAAQWVIDAQEGGYFMNEIYPEELDIPDTVTDVPGMLFEDPSNALIHNEALAIMQEAFEQSGIELSYDDAWRQAVAMTNFASSPAGIQYFSAVE